MKHIEVTVGDHTYRVTYRDRLHRYARVATCGSPLGVCLMHGKTKGGRFSNVRNQCWQLVRTTLRINMPGEAQYLGPEEVEEFIRKLNKDWEKPL